MKQLTIFLSACLYFYLVYTFEFGFGSVLFCLTAIFIFLFYHRLDTYQTLKYYANLREPIIVVSNHPDTGEEMIIEQFKGIIVNVPYTEVLSEVKRQKEWLERSKNPFLDPGLQENQKLPVDHVIFQDAEAINEDWNKDFRKRVKKKVKNLRSQFHIVVKEASPEYYHKYMNNQSGVIWKKEN